MSTRHKIVVAVVVCTTVGILIGTIARSPGPASSEIAAPDGYRPADVATATAIGERVTTYWRARTRQDLYGAYPFYEAGFRTTYKPETFVKTFQRLNRFAPELAGIERIDMDASGTSAKVVVKLRSKPAVLDGEELTSTTEDVWLLVDGVWWRQAEAMTPAI